MLARASFRNFKGLEEVEVGLSPLTVLVGKNGAGKTSVLVQRGAACRLTDFIRALRAELAPLIVPETSAHRRRP